MSRKWVSLLLFTFVIVSLSMTASAKSITKELIYDALLEDFEYQTGLDRQESDSLFKEILSDNLQSEVICKEIATLTNAEMDEPSIDDIVLYIQENYDLLTKDASDAEKRLIDKYYLGYAIKYYEKYAQPQDYEHLTRRAAERRNIEENNYDYSSLAAGDEIAHVRIFATAEPTEGSGPNLTGHAWITVANLSSSNITVGGFSGVGSYKEATVGTWSSWRTPEHNGVWYNYEGYTIRTLGNRKNLHQYLTSSQLNSLNSFIKNNDGWSGLYNCASFARDAWNLNASTSMRLTAGLINTPAGLLSSMQSKGGLSTNGNVAKDYAVHYRATNPIRSQTYN